MIASLDGTLYSADDDLREKDIADLVDHLRDLPPETYDIEAISEFRRKPSSEADLRRSVENIYAKTVKGAPPGQTREERLHEIDREVQRLLEAQKHPRRIRMRCLYSKELGYRVEWVIEMFGTNSALDTGPVEKAPFNEIRVNLGGELSGNTESFFLNTGPKIAEIHIEPGARVQNEQLWTGGTLGWLNISLLRNQLQIGKPEEKKWIDLLTTGQHPKIQLTVKRDIQLPDGSSGRRFQLQASDGKQSIKTSFDVPKDSFNPVWKVSFPNRTPMEVLEASDGVAQVWIDRENNSIEGGKKYTLISRKLNIPLDEELFKFDPPAGYATVDHRVNPPVITYPDGRVEISEGVPAVPKEITPRKWPKTIIVSNVLLVVALILFVIASRYGRNRNTPAHP